MSMNFFRFLVVLAISGIGLSSYGQGTCASPLALGTIGTSTACSGTINNGTTGSAPCAGSGYGGSGGVTYVSFCTGAVVSCINFNITQGTSSGNWAVTVYSSNCTTVVDAQCLGNSGTGASYNTSSPTTPLQPNSCYIARFWSGNAGTTSFCASALPATNNYCPNATAISTSPTSFNNFCMTAGSNGSYTEPAPAQFCAGSLENNAWYSFTTLASCTAPCSVVVTASNIVCSGGGAGFQMGFWTGTCGSLTNIGCSSGSGGAVTATITGLSPGQTIIMGMDGNAGANCTYSLSATNTIPLPIELVSFDAISNKKNVELKWITATEINNDFFTIERSRDGVVFEELRNIKSKSPDGNSYKTLSYQEYDYSPYPGTSYYRLKQTDYDKTFKYSVMKVVNLDGNPDQNFEVVPNPVSGIALLKYACNNDQRGTATIYDHTGSLVSSHEIECKAGENVKTVDMSQFNNGIYFVVFSAEGKFYKIKVVKN
jgi:hypothetical protein